MASHSWSERSETPGVAATAVLTYDLDVDYRLSPGASFRRRPGASRFQACRSV